MREQLSIFKNQSKQYHYFEEKKISKSNSQLEFEKSNKLIIPDLLSTFFFSFLLSVAFTGEITYKQYNIKNQHLNFNLTLKIFFISVNCICKQRREKRDYLYFKFKNCPLIWRPVVHYTVQLQYYYILAFFKLIAFHTAIYFLSKVLVFKILKITFLFPASKEQTAITP